jgi:hypothetical protein
MLMRRLAATYAHDVERRNALLIKASGMHAKRYEILRNPIDLDAIYEILKPFISNCPRNMRQQDTGRC